jgi:phosphoglycerate-specific signal transduction histidine kinase
MKWFQDLPIARKLAVGFTLTTLMTLVLGAFALLRLSEANAQLARWPATIFPRSSTWARRARSWVSSAPTNWPS